MKALLEKATAKQTKSCNPKKKGDEEGVKRQEREEG